MEYLIKKLGIQEENLLVRTFSNISLLSLSLLIKLNHVIKLFAKILNGNLTFTTLHSICNLQIQRGYNIFNLNTIYFVGI